MPTCQACDGTHEADELVRHEREGVVTVHCPDCHATMGRYREGGAPRR